METLSHFLARSAQNDNDQTAAAAGIVLDTVDVKPDEAATDMQVATDFAKITGKPQPPLSMVRDNRPIFEREIERQRNSTVLRNAPKLADWLKTPENAAVARDDLDGLSWWERNLGPLGRATGRGVRSVMSAPDVATAEINSQMVQDIGRSPDDIYNDLIAEQRAKYGDDLPDFIEAGARERAQSRFEAVTGMGQPDRDRLIQEGAQALRQAREAIDRAQAVPMSGPASGFRDGDLANAENSVMGVIGAFASNPTGGLAFLAETAAESLPTMLAGGAATAITRSPAVGAAVMGGGSFLVENQSAAMDFLQKQGVSLKTPEEAAAVLQNPEIMNEARRRGLERGMIVGAMDAMSGGLASQTFVKSHLGQTVVNAVAQAAFGAGGETLGQVVVGDGLDWKDIVLEGLAEFATAPLEAATVGGRSFMRNRERAIDAENRQAVFQEIAGQAVSSKVRARMPDVFRRFVEKATENGPVENVYVPADKFVEYFQSRGVDPFDLANQIEGVSDADLREAVDQGGDLKIPTASYAAKIAGSEHDAFFNENLKFDPDGMTSTEAREFNERAGDALQEAYAEAERLRQDDESLRTFEAEIYDTMVSRLREAGRATDVATTEAMLYPAFYRVMASRAGMTTEDFVRKYPLPMIRGDVPQGVRLRENDELNRTLAEARAQRGVVSDRRQSLLEFIAERGGINDVGGELKARDAEVIKRGRGKKSLRLRAEGAADLAGQKFGVDDVALAAIDAGFLADDPRVVEYRAAQQAGREAPDLVPALWDAIESELRGEKQTSGTVEPGDESLAQIEAYLAELGVSLDDSDDAIRSAIKGDQDAPRRMFSQLNRGSISFPSTGIAAGETIISLFRSANLSTFIHESGHYFLTVMQDMAGRGEASAQADFVAIKDWWRANAADVARDGSRVMGDVQLTAEDVIRALDEGQTGELSKDIAIDVGMQEQFARAFEAYLMEGKAPSSALRQAFEKFRAWMTAVYRKLAGLNVKPSDELRAVFDRMLATDQEIEAARAETADTGVIATAEQLGMTAEQYAGLLNLHQQAKDQASARLLRETLEPIKREREQWYREEKERVTAEIEAEINAQPVYRAFEWMGNRRWLGGEKPEGIADMRLDKAALVSRYGEGVLKTLPRGQFTVYAVEGGVDPDYAAGVFGLASGDQLVRALEQAPPRRDAIRDQVERTMFERHGDPLNDGTVEQMALDAVHGDKRGQALAAELKALDEIVGTDRGLTHKEAREIARQTLERAKIRDARAAQRYLAAERRAGRQAIRLAASVTRTSIWAQAAQRRVEKTARGAVREGDVDALADDRHLPRQIDSANTSVGRANEEAAKLVEAKRQQLLNHMLYSEARKIDAEVDAELAKAAKLNRPDRKLGKTANIDHVRAARAIAAKFGMARPDDAFDFNMWIEQLQFDDPAVASAMTDAIATYSQNAAPFRDLTVSEFRTVRDAIASVIETGKRYRMLEVEGKNIEREEAINDLVAVLRDRGLRDNPAMKAKLTGMQKMGKAALTMVAGLRRAENWARDMDNGEQGVFTRYLVKPIMEAAGVYRQAKNQRLRELLEIIEPRKRDLLGSGKIDAPELGYTFENKAEILHAILHTGNSSNLEKLLLGRGWSDGLVGQTQKMTTAGKPSVDRKGNPIMTRGTVDTSRWDGFVQRMIDEGRITKEDFDTAQSIWDLMEELKRPAQAAHRKIHGFYFNEIEATPLETPFGRYRGGYVPAVADLDASSDGQIRADQQAMEQTQSSFIFPTTGSGFTKSRVQNYRTPLAMNLMLLPSHMDKVLRFTHLEPAIRQTAGLVNQRDLRSALDGFDPAITSNLIVPWLQRTAQQAVEAKPATPSGRAAATLFRELRRRVGVGTMFLNVVNAAQQVTGFSSAAILVKPTRLKNALIRFATDAGAMRDEAVEMSAYMKDRIDDGGRLVGQRIEEAITMPTVAGDVRKWVDRHGYFLQTGFQNMIDVVTWHGAYDQAIANGLTDKEAVFEADSVIRRAMGDFAPENISLFETGPAFVRLFTMFFSYFNGQANLVGGEMQTVLRNLGWRGTPRAAMIYLLGIAIPAIGGELIAKGLRGELGDDDDDGYLDEIGELFFGTQARYVAGMIPGVGQISTLMMSMLNDKPYDDRLSVSPAISGVERTVRAPISVGSAVFGEGSSQKAVSDGLYALGVITGLPTGQLAKTLGYAASAAEGRSRPEGPADVEQGLLSGRDGTE